MGIDENICLYSGLDLSLEEGQHFSYSRCPSTYLASEREAVLAMTALDRFEIAVRTSISCCDEGGVRRISFALFATVQGGRERKFSISMGTHTPVGKPSGEIVASHLKSSRISAP